MGTHSLNHSSPSWKRLAYTVTSVSVGALLLLLPQVQHALPAGSHPVQAAAAKLLGPVAMLLPGANDFWHTDGNRILDNQGRTVRIFGMNWSGLETKEAVPGGLEIRDYREILDTIKQNGYNTVRLPFSNEMVEHPTTPGHIRFSNLNGSINTDLRELTSLQILDRLVAYSGEIGLKVILDNHRSEAGSSAQESGLWYTTQFPESAWIEDWTVLANRYRNTSTVIGMDLRNEPHNADKGGACWDCGGPHDWHLAAQRAGDAILAVNPRLLIFVEGVDSYAGDTYWWGGNLEGVRRSPVHLCIPNRLVYSAHEYGPAEYAQPWFNATTSPAILSSIWRRHWAYISESGVAPVWIGEFGTSNHDTDVVSTVPGSAGQWFTALVEFLGGHPTLGWAYWGVNGEDRYGLLDALYSSQPASQLKAEALASIRNGSHLHTLAVTLQPEPYTPAPSTSRKAAANSEISTQILGRSAITRLAQTSTSALIEQKQGLAVKVQKSALHSQWAITPGSDQVNLQPAIAASVHQAISTANRSLANESERVKP